MRMQPDKDPARSRAKRAVDIAVALGALAIASPALLVAALLIRWSMGRPVLFRQERPGLHGRPFTLLKFRTMSHSADPSGRLLSDGERLTRLGVWLRRTSVDELPELWNVLRGEMSLVGPRPLLLKYLPFFTPEENLRFSALPGITGWAQIHGRNAASWDSRLANDVWYVRHWSLLLDWKILWRTVAKVVRCEHVIADPRSTMLDLDQERARMEANLA